MRRAPRGCTYEPCPGCATTELHSKPLCLECARKLKLFDQLQREAAAGGDGMQPMNLKSVAYALPYLPHLKESELQKKFWELSWALSKPTDQTVPQSAYSDGHAERQSHWLWPMGARDFDHVVARLMNPALAALVRDIFALARAGLDEAYGAGVADGKSLLLSLASGRITSDEFNAKAARLEGRPAGGHES